MGEWDDPSWLAWNRKAIAEALDAIVGDHRLVTYAEHYRCPHCAYQHMVSVWIGIDHASVDECLRCGATWRIDDMEGDACPF